MTSRQRLESAPALAALGWTGKLPSQGDFVARRVPPSFREPWDRWLGIVLAGSRERLRARWSEAFLSAPVWRFVLGYGVVDAGAWAGLLLPSVDSVGRYYPLTVVCALPEKPLDPEATLMRARSWFAAIEPVALAALAPNADLAAFDAALAALSFPPEALADRQSEAAPATAWLVEDTEIFGRRVLLGDGLPSAEQYGEMLTGEPAARERTSV